MTERPKLTNIGRPVIAADSVPTAHIRPTIGIEIRSAPTGHLPKVLPPTSTTSPGGSVPTGHLPPPPPPKPKN